MKEFSMSETIWLIILSVMNALFTVIGTLALLGYRDISRRIGQLETKLDKIESDLERKIQRDIMGVEEEIKRTRAVRRRIVSAILELNTRLHPGEERFIVETLTPLIENGENK